MHGATLADSGCALLTRWWGWIRSFEYDRRCTVGSERHGGLSKFGRSGGATCTIREAVRLFGNSEEVLVQSAIAIEVLKRGCGVSTRRQILEVHGEVLILGRQNLAHPLAAGDRKGLRSVVDGDVDLASIGSDSRDLDSQLAGLRRRSDKAREYRGQHRSCRTRAR